MLRRTLNHASRVMARTPSGSLLRPSALRVLTTTGSVFSRAMSSVSDPSKVRNVAIIAHVDHGKFQPEVFSS